MSALTILLIRHAEKPDPNDPDLGPGLTKKGSEDKHSLVIRGWQRAGAWAVLFVAGTTSDFPKPDLIYAANPDQSSSQEGSHSRRPFETILPLCAKLHITPNTTYGVDEEDQLVSEIEKLTGVVLICWEHKRIIDAILPALAKDQKIPHLPAKWCGARFDVVLRFDCAKQDGQWSFRQLFPRLLGGDLDLPVCKSK